MTCLPPLRPGAIDWREFSPPGDPGAWSHSGAAVLPDGRVAVAEADGGALLLVDESGGEAERIPLPTADAHGIVVEGDALLVADPGTGAGDGQVLRVDVATGAVEPVPPPDAATGSRWRPTSVAVGPDGTRWIADGYGESRVHAIAPDGEATRVDARATGTAFDCPHGIVIDDRAPVPLVVIADRGNRRLVVLDLDGELDRVVEDPLLTSPSSLAVRGLDLLVTDLFGALLRVDELDRVEALLPIRDPDRDAAWPNAERDGVPVRPPLRDGVLRSPHGIAVGPGGAVYLTEWLLGGRQIRLDPARRPPG